MMKLYVNGSLDSTTTDAGGLGSPASYPNAIGRLGSGAYPFSGIIDDARIYNRVLSPAEIAALYNAQK